MDFIGDRQPIFSDPIRIEHGRYILKDLTAKNGCYRNGTKILPSQEVQFGEGDQITFGRYAFYFTSAEKVYEQLRKS